MLVRSVVRNLHLHDRVSQRGFARRASGGSVGPGARAPSLTHRLVELGLRCEADVSQGAIRSGGSFVSALAASRHEGWQDRGGRSARFPPNSTPKFRPEYRRPSACTLRKQASLEPVVAQGVAGFCLPVLALRCRHGIPICLRTRAFLLWSNRAHHNPAIFAASEMAIMIKSITCMSLALAACFQTVGCSGSSPSSSAPNSRQGNQIRPALRADQKTPLVERPLIVQQSQGESREWRPLASLPAGVQKLSVFTIKVDEHNGGSPDFWFGTETMPPGAEIQPHRHLHEDEVLYLGSGRARIHVGTLQRDAGPGAIVFIPRNTWVSLKNIGNDPIAMLFAFNAPGFDRFMRCESVPAGQRAQAITDAQDKRCIRVGDVQYR